MDKNELIVLIQNNFGNIANVLDEAYLEFFKNSEKNVFEDATKILSDFTIIVNEYVKFDNTLNIKLIVANSEKLVNAIKNRDSILLSDILRFELQEYLQVMFNYLELN